MDEKRAFLDTTVQIDRNKTRSRREILDGLLADFGWKFGTSISQLEFKATIVQECITIHNELRGKRFTAVRDSLVESNHHQAKLRSHIFNNLLQVWGSSFDVDEVADRQLAEDARLNLELIIPDLYSWFEEEESVDAVLRDKIDCTRAKEAPFKKKAAFDNSMPICARDRGNKRCTVEKAIRENGRALIDKIKPLLKPTDDGLPSQEDKQLARSIQLFEEVIAGEKNDLNHRHCRSCGDCLMALEVEGKATHALSSNVTEWERLASAAGMVFVRTTFDDERNA